MTAAYDLLAAVLTPPQDDTSSTRAAIADTLGSTASDCQDIARTNAVGRIGGLNYNGAAIVLAAEDRRTRQEAHDASR